MTVQSGVGLLILAIVLGILASLLPLPGVVGTIIYVAAVICAVVGLIALILGIVRR